MPDVVVEVAGSEPPDGLAALAEVADREGVRNVRFLVDRWSDAPFDRAGERLLVARSSDGRIVAVGGLTWCPDVPGALRVRRFYVDPAWRRRGVARTMAAQLLDAAAGHTDTVTCNARASAAAAPFWESLGFEPAGDDAPAGITHLRRA